MLYKPAGNSIVAKSRGLMPSMILIPKKLSQIDTQMSKNGSSFLANIYEYTAVSRYTFGSGGGGGGGYTVGADILSSADWYHHSII